MMARVPSMARLRLPLILVSAVTVMVLLGVGFWRANQDPCFSLIVPSICRVQVSEPLVALTFDDGPTSIGVDIALDALGKRGIQATFFLIGKDVSQRPDLAARIVKAGHELGNHSFSHVPMVGRSRQFYDQEISETNRLLRSAGGRSNLFRPPYGQKRFGLPLALRRHSLTMVLWDIDDWPATDPQTLAADVVDSARPGSIILLHVMNPENEATRQALPHILDGLQAKGLRPVSVSALLAAAERARSVKS